jgi:hypothetical protein
VNPSFERALAAGFPQAPRNLWSLLLALWERGWNTLEIATELNLKECAVYNSLPKARAEAR